MISFFKEEFNPFALKKYFKNTSWSVFEKAYRSLLTAVVGFFIIRYLGPDRYGAFGYTISFLHIFAPIGSLGLYAILLRDFARFPEKSNRYLGTAFILHAFSAFVAIGLAVLFLLILKADKELFYYVVIALSSLILHPFIILEFFFHANTKAKWVAYTQSISFTIISILKIVFMLMKLDLIYFIILVPVEQCLSSFGFLTTYLINGGKLKSWVFDKKLAVSLLGQSWFYIGSAIALRIYFKSDQIMIQQWLGERQNGFYAAATRFSEASYFLPIAICNSLIPALVNAKMQDFGRYLRRFQQLYDLLAWIAIPKLIFIFFTANYIIIWIIGESYSPSIEILQIHVLSLLFVFTGVVSDNWLLQEKLYKYILLRHSFGAVLNVVLNLIFLGPFGIVGAAYSTLISYSFSYYFFFLFFKKTRTIFLMQTKSFFAPARFILKRLR